MRKFLLSCALLSTMSLPAMAQGVVTLPDGQTALNISATERVEVDQDTLVASLRIQQDLKSAAEVQNVINLAMKQAVELAKKHDDFQVETGQYYVHPDYRDVRDPQTGDVDQVIEKWTGSQTLIIKSENAADLLKVTGEIQDMGFVMNSLNYELSSKKFEQTRDGLMEATIKKLKDRAERVAKALGKTSVDIVEINVDAQSHSPQPVYARAVMMEMRADSSAKMATPTAEAGTSDVSMTINARAIIK